jgi:hypothetical protein
MNNKKHLFKSGKAGFALNTGILIALTGCLSFADGQGIRISVPLPVVVVSPPVVVVAPPVVVAEDNYVYYPSYGVYYNTSRHQYAYADGGVWVLRPAPMGVSADVLLASPSVKMDFHDSPANHHAVMAQKYPKNYKAARSEQKAGGREEHREK